MTPDDKAAYARSFPVHVGIDTAKQFHVLVALGPDGRRLKPFTVQVSRAGFAAAHAHLQQLFPAFTPSQMLVGLEFAGHHGFTFAQFLSQQGYPVVNVLPAHTKKARGGVGSRPYGPASRRVAHRRRPVVFTSRQNQSRTFLTMGENVSIVYLWPGSATSVPRSAPTWRRRWSS